MTDMSPQINEAVEAVITWFTDYYTDESGFPCYDVDGTTGKRLSDRNLLCEFDDYAPFFWYLGQEKYILKQVDKIEQKVRKGKLFFKRPQIRRFKGLGLPGRFRRLWYADSQDYVEILYGLNELYTLSGNQRFLTVAESLMDILLKSFYRDHLIGSFRLMPWGPTIGMGDAMSGMFLEILADMASVTDDSERAQRWTEISDDCLKSWISTRLFREYGVFPLIESSFPWSLLPGSRKKTMTSELAKSNASMGYALLTLASSPHENPLAISAFDKWIDGIHQYFLTPLGVLTHTPTLENGTSPGPILSTNFAVLDLLCDAAWQFNRDDCRDLAVSIARYFLKFQSEHTGLIPDNPGEDRSYIDANSDFAVSLAKLSEVTGEPAYRDSGCRIVQGILKYHRGEFGYFRDVDLDTGEPVVSLVETRFCSLLLKTLILYRDNLKIYGDGGQWSMFRDR